MLCLHSCSLCDREADCDRHKQRRKRKCDHRFESAPVHAKQWHNMTHSELSEANLNMLMRIKAQRTGGKNGDAKKNTQMNKKATTLTDDQREEEAKRKNIAPCPEERMPKKRRQRHPVSEKVGTSQGITRALAQASYHEQQALAAEKASEEAFDEAVAQCEIKREGQ